MSASNGLSNNVGDQPALTETDLQQLLQRMAALEEENRTMRQQGSRLEQENQHLRSFTPPLVQPSASNLPKVSLPDKYDGNPKGFRGFVNQLNLVFVLNESRYSTDRIKIFTLGSLLIGRALSWFNPYIEHPESYANVFSSYGNFIATFRATFGPVDPAITAANEIRRLNQGKGSASSYASTFVQLAADLGWNDAALISQFRSGLNNEVKDMLVYHDYPTSLDQAISVAVRCDRRLYENRLEQRSRGGYAPATAPRHAVTSTPVPALSGPTPMDIDAVQTGGRHPPVSDAERQRRRENNLCFRCGEPGHIAPNCRLNRSGNAQNQ